MDSLVERLREQARSASRASKMLADAKSARQSDRDDYPDLARQGYAGVEPEQTIEWQAAATITSLQQRVEELEAKLANSIQWAGGQSPLVCGPSGSAAARVLTKQPADEPWRCKCFARSPDECACGAWDVPIPDRQPEG